MPLTGISLGPGELTLTIGDAPGTPLEVSCLVEAFTVSWNKTKVDDTPRLCGDVLVGKTTYDAVAKGTFDQDLDDPAGLLYATWTHKGTTAAFVYVPNTAAGTQVSGTLVLDPLDVGGSVDDDNLQSDFEWACVGEPVLAEVVP
jgi:hypothetical protein